MEAFAETFDIRATVKEVGSTVSALMDKKNNRLVLDFGEKPMQASASCTPTSRACARSCSTS